MILITMIIMRKIIIKKNNNDNKVKIIYKKLINID